MAQIDALQALHAILQMAQEAGGRDADDLPREDYNPRSGFLFADNLRSINCDSADKEAMCVHDVMATIVTKQVLKGSDECEFRLRVLDVSGEDRGKPIVFGVCSDVPSGFSRLPIGHRDLASSIGACCCRTDGAVMYQSDKVSDESALLALKDGDVVKIKVKPGSKVSLHKGPLEFHSFSVAGDGKFRIGVSMCSKGQRVKIIEEDADGADGSVGALAALLEIARALDAAGVGGQTKDSIAASLPDFSYEEGKGFTWVDGKLDAVTCDNRQKVATCTASTTGSMVTEQILTKSDRCDFVLRFVNAAGEENKPITFGVVNDVPLGFLKKAVGDKGFANSIGARCGEEQGVIVLDGEVKKQIPGIRDGEIVKIEVRPGSQISFTKGSQRLLEFRVNGDGKFRFGVSLSSKGQQVEILDVVREGNNNNVRDESGPKPLLKVGYEVQLPEESDPRLKTMRTNYQSAMASHCGCVGRVIKVNPRCARIEVDGNEFLWDIEVFPPEVFRCCHEGCRLKEDYVDGEGRVCDVCRVRLPKGTSTRACRTHDYDVCRYCQGHKDVPQEGSAIVRGPTWKWGEQDGEPYTEGICSSKPDRNGWLTVDWPSGKQSRYRVNDYYQDVWLAHENGLQGQKPVEADESGHKQLRELMDQVMKLAEAASTTLPTEQYSPSQGFTFVAPPTSELRLQSSKKDLMSVGNYRGSLVTEQIVDASQPPVLFQLRIKHLPLDSKGFFAWGVCSKDAHHFQSGFPGHSEFKGSIGAFVTAEIQCILNDNDPKGMIPQVAVGDMVGIKFGRGNIAFMHKGRVVHEVGVSGGQFRFAVCLGNRGQHVEVVSGDEVAVDGMSIGANIRKVEVGSGRGQLQYDDSSLIGEGGFGRVYKGKISATPVIVKVLKEEAMTEALRESFENEVKVLASFQHPHLVLFIAMNPDLHIIVTEYCVHGDLEGYLTTGQGKTASNNERRQLMLECSQGINFLHDSDVVHRDLKPVNVFVARGPQAKVGDFGLAAPLVVCQEDARNGVAGTITYMAPEVFIGQISPKSDVYSFSMVLGFAFGMEQLDVSRFTNIDKALLVAHLVDEPGIVHQHIIKAIREGKRPKLPYTMPPEIKALVTHCWDERPEIRPVCTHICEHLEQPLVELHPIGQTQARPAPAGNMTDQADKERQREAERQRQIEEKEKEMTQLWQAMRAAAEKEDYPGAQQLKTKIEALGREVDKLKVAPQVHTEVKIEERKPDSAKQPCCCALQ